MLLRGPWLRAQAQQGKLRELRRGAAMKPINPFPLIVMLILVLLLIYWIM